MKRKIVSGIMLTLLFIGMLTLAFNIQPVKSEPTTIVVPDDYPTIQEAINSGDPGDTIFVRIGTYYEHVVVNKSVSLVGESKDSTTIEGNTTSIPFEVTTHQVKISNFTIRNVDTEVEAIGISLKWVHQCIVSNNILLGSYIYLRAGLDNVLTANTFINGCIYMYLGRAKILNNTIWGKPPTSHLSPYPGITLFSVYTGTIVENNTITNGWRGIFLKSESDGGIIRNNLVSNMEEAGIYVHYSSNNVFTRNIVTQCKYGFSSIGSDSNQIYENTFVNNQQYGIYKKLNDGNSTIFHNNLVNNSIQAFMEIPSFPDVWDDGYPSGGNYWSDYNGTDLYSGPYQNETGSDGIGDTPYVIDENSQDNYPLMQPYHGPVRNLNTGQSYPTIQEAINNASDGDRIFALSGTYYEHVVIDKSVSLIGENRSTTIIDGNGTGVVVTVKETVDITGFTIGNGSTGVDVGFNANGTIIEGNVIAENENYGIYSWTSNNIISNNIIMNNTKTHLWLQSGLYLARHNNTIFNNNISANDNGIFLSGSHNNRISNNVIVDNYYPGIELYGSCFENIISDNVIQRNGDAGIYLRGSTFKNTITKNVVRYNRISGIWIKGYNHNISGNVVANNPYGVSLQGTNSTLYNNTIINNGFEGVKVNGNFLTVRNNNITANGIHNIRVLWGANNTISTNILAHAGTGIRTDESHNNTIRGNTINNNDYGILIFGAYNPSNRTIGYHNNFINNVVQAVDQGFENLWDNGYPSGGNYWSDYNGTDLFSGPYQNQTGPDGIGDTPYIIDMNNKDNYPLISPWSPVTIQNTNITKGGTAYPIQVISNATILNFKETPGSLKLSVSGAKGTYGYVRVIQPIGLNSSNIKVFLNNTRLTFPSYNPPASISNNSTHYFIYFAFTFNSVYELTVAFPIEGDANYDGIVNIVDVVIVALAFGSTQIDPNWNPHADLNGDNFINIVDIVMAAIRFGETW